MNEVPRHIARAGQDTDSGRRSTRRSNWAFSATTIVESDIISAPTAGRQHESDRREHSRRQRDRDHVVANRPGTGSGPSCGSSPGRGPHANDRPWIAGGEDHARRGDRDIGPGADRNPDIGLGKGRGIVDAIAHHRHDRAAMPAGPSLRPACLPGSTSARISSTPRVVPTESATGLRVTGDHHHAHAVAVKRIDRLAATPAAPRLRARARRSPRHRARRGAWPRPDRPLVRDGIEGCRNIQAASRNMAGPPTATVAPSTVASTPDRHWPGTPWPWGLSDTVRLGLGHDRAGERVLAVGLDRGREGEQVALVHARQRRRPRSRRARPSSGCRSCRTGRCSTSRIRSSARRSLTRMPLRAESAVEIAITSGIASPSAWGHEMTRTVTVRVIASSMSPNDDPGDEGHDAGTERDVEEDRRKPVGQHLRVRARRLGIGNHPLDAGEGGFLADGGDADPDRGPGHDRPGDHPVAQCLVDRTRFAGDHRLVDPGRAVDDLAIGRDPCARPDQDGIPGCGGRPPATVSIAPSAPIRSASSGRSAARAESAPWA